MPDVKKLYVLDEGQIVARIDKRVLPDLDAVLLEMLTGALDEGAYFIENDHEDDLPTRLGVPGEARVRHRRISPCFCGDHGWHMDWVSEDENGTPNRPDARGAFLAVEVG